MAKKVIKKTSSSTTTRDTTKIPTPYKVSRSELGMRIGSQIAPTPDSTKKKVKYNVQTVTPAILKRNQERAKEGKQPIKTGSIITKGYGYSDKGKTFKESPLKTVKKKTTKK